MTVILVIMTIIIFLAADQLVSMYTKMFDARNIRKVTPEELISLGALAQDGGTPYVKKDKQ